MFFYEFYEVSTNAFFTVNIRETVSERCCSSLFTNNFE